MSIRTIDSRALSHALSLRDLSDPLAGPHAMPLVVDSIHESLAKLWQCRRIVYRGSPLVAVKDNYDRLGYPQQGIVRDAKYNRYVTPSVMLRAHTSAMIPGLLRSLSIDPPDDVLLICPGLVYRRDSIDRLHTGEPHHLDLWRITKQLARKEDLECMIQTVVESALPGHEYRTVPS